MVRLVARNNNMRGSLCIFGVLAVLMPMLAFAETQPAQTVELTDAQALAVSDMMIGAGDLNAATDLLNDILGSDDVNIRIRALFNLGRVAIANGDYNTAQKYLLTILKWHPGYTNARIELARAYMLANDYENADFQLRLALGDKNLPEPVAQQVQMMLNYVRQNKTWAVNAGLSLVPDTNINYATGQSQECVDFGFGPMCRQIPKQESGIGLRYDVGADYFWRLSNRFSIRNSISLSALDFKTSQYDNYSLYLATGPRYTGDKWELSIQPFVQMHWYGSKYYNTAPGIRADASVDITQRIDVDFGGAFMRTLYHDDAIDKFWRSNEYTAYIQPRYYLNNKSFVQIGAQYSNVDALEHAYSNTSQTYYIGYYSELPWTLNIYARLDFTNTEYKDDMFFITNDHKLRSFTRKDTSYRGYLRLATRYFEPWRIYPALNYTYTTRNSNVPAYEYEKHRLELNINYRF